MSFIFLSIVQSSLVANMPKRQTLSRDDIAAMEVVCDRKAAFSHRLNLSRIDVRWILDLKGDKKGLPPRSRSTATSATHSARGDNDRPKTSETLDNISPVKEGDQAPSSVADPDDYAALHSARSSATGMSTASSVRRGHKRFRFVNPPTTFLTLRDLDRTQVIDPKDAQPLINSPRSAFIVLKNGYSMMDVCGVPAQEYYNKALLDGVTVETVKMRIAAEEERRIKKFNSLLSAYDSLCREAEREEVVEAIRTHKYAEDLTREEDEARLKEIPHYAHPGNLDLTVLDSDCVDVLQKSRSRTLQEIRRSLDQRDRLLKQSIERETAVMEKERQAAMETQRVQMEAARARDEKANQQKERRREVERRVEKLLQSQAELTEVRRAELLQEQEHQANRVKEKKKLEKYASVAMIADRDQRRKQVRQQQEQLLEEKRENLLQRQELQAKMKERELQLKRQAAAERSQIRNEIAEKRRETIRQLSEKAALDREEKQLTMEEEAEIRAREYARMREIRQERKRERQQKKSERTSYIRQQGDQIKRHRLMELERDYQEKLRGIELAQREKEDRAALEKEMAAQVHLEKQEEKERAMNANEFHKVAYVSGSNAKQRWMERSQQKRKVLSSQVRQEREAMIRAKTQVFNEIERQEIKRRKEAAYQMLRFMESPLTSDDEEYSSERNRRAANTSAGSVDNGIRHPKQDAPPARAKSCLS